MPSIVHLLWLIPVFPTLTAGITALLRHSRRKLSAGLAISSMSISLLLAITAFVQCLAHPVRQIVNFKWMQFGSEWIRLGWGLDPLTAIMLVMIAFVGLLIFIYSLSYMAHDKNFTRFFCFLSLFAGAMFGLVIANSFLLLFMCWEVVGLTSYLLIGFWYDRPAAAAAAKKAFLTTRIGDLGLLLGIVWLYSKTGTLLFYDHGAGCLEHGALSSLLGTVSVAGMPAFTAIALLIFCGAVGKSGQLPLHVWLPDAMEGPTPVSALIHAATMVAAGVYLVARAYPLMGLSLDGVATALKVVAWTGAITAVFAASIAIAQNDIKRILAYSTISQIGYMMLGLGVGGVAVAIFHLIAHAFFKALLFMGAGSVIHGCTEEQDIRNMGGLRRFMPITFVTYAIGTLALCGFPLLFSGFWSKDAILHAAHRWGVSQIPFYLGVFGALLTAFYMTRQVCYVFLGKRRKPEVLIEPVESPRAPAEICAIDDPRESPSTMTGPLVILAFFTIILGFHNTPAWPWFTSFLEGTQPSISASSPRATPSWNPVVDFSRFTEAGLLPLMLFSSLVVFAGLGIGWWLYGRKPIARATDPDALEKLSPGIFRALQNRLYIDELYEHSILALARGMATFSVWLDRWVWNGAVQAVRWLVTGLGWMDASLDKYAVNAGFDEGCRGVTEGGRAFSLLQNGRVQSYLSAIAIALVVLAAVLLWRSGA
jgi:NADH-quinone oxidoreductase subunit L